MGLVELAERFVEIPKGVRVEVTGGKVKVAGPKGSLESDFSHMPVQLSLEDERVLVRAYWARKRQVAMVGTAAAKIRNMIRGVTAGYTYKMKIVHAHFPVTVKVLEDDRKVLIENFIGEKTPRVANIVGDVKVKVVGDEVIIQGINLDEVGQTASNIQAATRIKHKDQRVFLDGIYVAEKLVGM